MSDDPAGESLLGLLPRELFELCFLSEGLAAEGRELGPEEEEEEEEEEAVEWAGLSCC